MQRTPALPPAPVEALCLVDWRAADGRAEACHERLVVWLSRWPIKALARTFGASPRTVRGWRDRQTRVWPEQRTWLRMVDYWGADFLDWIYAPAVEPAPRDALAELRRLQGEVALAIRRAASGAGRSLGALLLAALVVGQLAQGGETLRAWRAPRPPGPRAPVVRVVGGRLGRAGGNREA